MKKQLRTIALTLGIGLASFCLSPVLMHAQQAADLDQRAYQAGYQNGVNAAHANRPMNMNTDDWHGDRLTAYQQGYQEGYRNAAGYGRNDQDRADRYVQDPQAQRAYQAGYQRGVRDRERNRAMNMKTDDWHGQRLQAYQQGYAQGYRSVRRRDRDDDDR